MSDPNPMSADPALAGALDTLHRLDDLGEYAYSQNAMPLITEAAARAAIVDAVTNRIRMLRDLLSVVPNVFPPEAREQAVLEYDRLLRSVVNTNGEA